MHYALIAAAIWVIYRYKNGLPIIPGAKVPHVLVQTQSGQVTAIPATTPTVAPQVAAVQGLLSPQATAVVSQALMPSTQISGRIAHIGLGVRH